MSTGLADKTLWEVEHFFVSYNKIAGKKFKVMGKGGPGKALAMVKKCRKNKGKA